MYIFHICYCSSNFRRNLYVKAATAVELLKPSASTIFMTLYIVPPISSSRLLMCVSVICYQMASLIRQEMNIALYDVFVNFV